MADASISISPLVSQLKMESDPHLLGFGFTVRVTSLHSKVRAGNFSRSGKEEGYFANDCIDTGHCMLNRARRSAFRTLQFWTSQRSSCISLVDRDWVSGETPSAWCGGASNPTNAASYLLVLRKWRGSLTR